MDNNQNFNNQMPNNIAQPNMNQANQFGQANDQNNGYGQSQPNMNDQNNGYGQPQQNMYGQPQQNIYGQQNMYNSIQNHNNSTKGFAKVIMIIASIVLSISAVILLVVMLIIGIATKEKEAISYKDVRSYLKQADIDYYDYDDYGILYGDAKVYETDELSIFVTECESESEAVKEFNEQVDALEEDMEFNVTTSVDGKNFDKVTRYDTSIEYGFQSIRVDDTILTVVAISDEAYEQAKDMFDTLGY